MAISLTPNYDLNLPDFDTKRYQDYVNNNMRIIDALLAKYIAVLNVRGVWENSTVYAVDEVVVDSVEGQLYRCLSEHTSASAPTIFSADRTAKPNVWASATLGVRARGQWETGEDYALGDYVVNEGIYAVCTTAHTAGATFAGDEANWEYLIDLTSVTELKAIEDIATDYTFVLTDANKLRRLTGATARTFTVPPEASVAFPDRTEIFLCQWGTGALSIAAGAGVTINSEFGWLNLNAQYSVATLLKVGTNEWLLTGSLRP